jgi:deoxyribodipyrimidine photolyase-like uncharacterized protein
MIVRVRLDNSTLKEMADAMGHCGNIASSALVLATERSDDIEVPTVITLMLLKKLCDVNITAQLEMKIPENMTQLATVAGLDIEQIRIDAFAAMEELIDDYWKNTKLKRRDFSG